MSRGSNTSAEFLARVRREQRARVRERRMWLARGAAPYSGPAFQGLGGLGSNTSGNTLFVTWPSHAANDIALAFVETANQAVATPSGWTAVSNGSQGVGTAGSVTATRLQVFWRRAASSSESTLQFPAIPGDHANGIMMTVRGCITSGDPVDVSAGDTTTDADASAVSIPGATTTVDGCLVVAACSRQTASVTAQQSGEANAALSSLAERLDVGNTLGNGGGLAVATGLKATAGAYGVTTATLSTASRQGHVSLALKPA
jgi:hypothetical protein